MKMERKYDSDITTEKQKGAGFKPLKSDLS